MGCLGALGYGGLSAIWAVGATIGMDDPELVHPGTTPSALWVAENLGTFAVAALAALILIALVTSRGEIVPRAILRTVGWLGTFWIVPGAAGLVEMIAGTHLFRATTPGGVSAATYVFIDVCYLTVGLAFAATSFLTRWRSSTGATRSPRSMSAA